jgi:hypothetical protein
METDKLSKDGTALTREDGTRWEYGYNTRA